jgi:hydroxyacylglutathione hydrolase
MKVEQIYTGCIAHAAYYLESNGEAAIFDPLREVEPYLERAAKDGAKIKYVFETHFHADFVSGHLDLAAKSGAQIVYGPTAKPGFDAIVAEDGRMFKVGDYTVKVIHTPGHTMESTCFLLIDENGKEHGIITGDTLFIGDVGRPDLAQHVISDLTEEKLAAHLFDSLRNKIMPLADHLIVYPNHGAGSACGKKMSKETTDSLGNQKRTNYALRADMSKEEFIKELLTGLTTPPAYFPKNVIMNIKGYDSLDTVMQRANRPLSARDFLLHSEESHVMILDTRDAEEFAKGHIPGSINIGLDGNFAMWVGEMIRDIKQELLLVSEVGREEEAIIRLSRVGYDFAAGYLEGGFAAWQRANLPISKVARMDVSALEQIVREQPEVQVFDVRKASEFSSQHLEGALNVPLNQIEQHFASFPKEQFFVLHCAGGYRSMIAASILKKAGWNNFADLRGGFAKIEQSNLNVTEYVCPSTLL